jgi:hypothetical protein
LNREDIIRIAQEAGLHIATDVSWMPIIGIAYAEKFAALVIANHPPQSYMTWQVGYEEGKQTEREACAKVCDDHFGWTPRMIGETIRARSYANDTSSKRVDITEEHKHD